MIDFNHISSWLESKGWRREGDFWIHGKEDLVKALSKGVAYPYPTAIILTLINDQLEQQDDGK